MMAAEFNKEESTMNGKLVLYLDQYGNQFWARTRAQLREAIGGGSVSKMYVDKPDPDAIADIDAAKARVMAAADNPPAEYGETVGAYHYWIAAADYDGLEPDDFEELKTLRALAAEGEQAAPDWHYGETLVRDSYFEDYARQLAEDIGAIPNDSRWPRHCIDWEQAARELQQDYTSIEFDDVTYWVR